MKIPCEYKEEMIFDYDIGNTNWKDFEILELNIIYNFDPFNFLGPVYNTHIHSVHTEIQVHLIYNYKQDGS